MPPTATDEDVQLQLIDVDHPEMKALKRLSNAYEKKKEARKLAKEEEDEARQSLVEKVREVGKPDALGNIVVKFGEQVVSIEPDEKVKIKHIGADEEGDEDEDADDKGTPPEAPTRKPRKE